MDEEEDSLYYVLESSRFWVQKVLVPILLCLGIAGNTLTIMVLTRRRMRSSTNIYLSALAIADIFHLIFGFLLSFTHYKNIHDRRYELYWRFYGLTHWLCDAASATSAWLTVSFTLERYIAVCHPMKGKVFCTEGRAKSIIVIVYIFCLLTTVSTTFEYQLTFNEDCLERCKVLVEESGDDALSSDVITNLNVSSHIIQPPSYDIIKREGVDRYLQHQLKTILANCTNKPHIIYVPISPELLNVSTVRDTTTGEIQNRTKRQYSETIEESLTGVSEPSKFLESIFPTKDSFQVLTETRGEKVIREAINGLEEPEEADNAQGNAEYIDVKDAARDGYDVKELGMMENSTDSSFENNEENSQDIQMTVDSNNITYKTYCCLKNLTIDVESTDLSKNMNYLNFIYWYSALFFGIIPLVLIATFNCFLIRAVYLSQQLRRVMTNSTENTMFSNERRITIILIGIVISFLVCNTPTSAHLIYYHFHKVSTPRENNIMRILGNIFNLMLMLNAPCNFLIYCVLSKKFRQTFKKIFCERRKKKQLDGDTLLLASTRKYRTPRNIEVTIYLFNRGKYVNTYQFCTRTNHLRSCFFSQRNTNWLCFSNKLLLTH
ncbi:unnamed protein product [Acanthoscelides obtectus]|uniref:G-protein coupled receptors family 1 profile domain-containing protein n=2 Tax=Acanthoscelides obtectus TaxID=200917 RepID=A0A9P0NRW9_ACAOB|nr:unnamed protein product [Acanthoscelides obtectus]CAK1624917.1 Thyrotropin-releasing hormone receptor [Acanthoscelides obtectus]